MRLVYAVAAVVAFSSHHASAQTKPKAAVPKPIIKSTVSPGKPVAPAPKIDGRGDPTVRPKFGFELTKASPGKLTLRFRTSDPNFELNPRGRLAVQLFSGDESLELMPVVITAGEWPKGKNEMTVDYKSTKAGKPVQIDVEAVFNVCQKAMKSCKNEGVSFSAPLTP
jgi:hypothetical protein